jgi:hypothetical protein
MYTVKGYAYSGGGRKIIRAEISLDLGVTWRLAEIRRFEEPTEYGEEGEKGCLAAMPERGGRATQGHHVASHVASQTAVVSRTAAGADRV